MIVKTKNLNQAAKTCSKCKQEKSLTEFYRDKHRKDNLTLWCRNCYSESRHMGRYNINLADREKMYQDQKGKCFLCGEKMEKPMNCYLDHNHATGRIRALLCSGCNTWMGAVDSEAWLNKAIEYRNHYA